MLVIYNTFCSITALGTFVGFSYGLHHSEGIYGKQPSDDLRMLFLIYWLTKIAELLDTVFMVLRHKRRQISFLHVYHHGSMLLLSDYSYHHYPWPSIAFVLSINAAVHMFLYLYYAVAAWDASLVMKWKPRLTELQITQFFIGLVFAAFGYIHHRFCIYSIFYCLIMIILFSNFYYQAYLRPKGSSSSRESKKSQ